MTKEYALFIDTNIFNIQKELDDFSEPFLFNKLDELVNKLEINDLLDKIQVCIPKVVLMELTKQQEERYFDEMQKFSGKKYPLFSPLKQEKYMNWLLKLFKNKLNKNQNFDNNVTILDYPSSSSFRKIINRAILKQDPFEGNNGKGESDKGFKDVLIWHTLLSFKKNNKQTKVILYSNDNKLTGDNCLDEYRKEFNEELIIARTCKEPYLDNILKEKFNIDKINLSEREKVAKFLNLKFKDHFYPNFLIGKSIYTQMGDELKIIDFGDIYPGVLPTDKKDEYYVLVQIVVIAEMVGNKSNTIVEDMKFSFIVKDMLSRERKLKIQKVESIHKDISQEEMYNMLKFIEESDE